MRYFQKLVNSFNSFALGMDSRDWAIAAVVLVVVGVICMRGAADKTNF